MDKKLEQALKRIREQAALLASDYDYESQAAFFGEMADWARAQQEAVQMAVELEMQNYDEECPRRLIT